MDGGESEKRAAFLLKYNHWDLKSALVDFSFLCFFLSTSNFLVSQWASNTSLFDFLWRVFPPQFTLRRLEHRITKQPFLQPPSHPHQDHRKWKRSQQIYEEANVQSGSAFLTLTEKQWFKEEPACCIKYKDFSKSNFLKDVPVVSAAAPANTEDMSIRRQVLMKPSPQGEVCVASANRRRVEEEAGESVSCMSRYHFIWNLFPVLLFFLLWPLVWFTHQKNSSGFWFGQT